ncbi:zinc ribbon domain-containing protein [candidate division KSB1 bacterium]|nr:zinc ribbon domain-containing protein [candidate division KSB1 bacterium]NIR71489.1 zinc ribbon domain-containing protein [candidate division KSB1 bacterium]NIS23410.1 zinc ribbon domain-containing protein [candidate division KSB1 bacterium]NIT70301.1 zinc ribbon domain-containing protein [candidate division KSB1 bacterium]NIU24024.1 zinc ribbon domain-containing protein [candidate division KSB1 bacterium]
MPTYDYLCSDCHHQFEEFQSITAPPLDKCPKCAGPVRRLISAGNGLIFKGSGFYITDYKRSDNGKTGGADKSDKSKSESSSEKRNETKSETKVSEKPSKED